MVAPPVIQETWFDSWVRKIPWRRDRLSIPVFLGFLGGSVGKESACNVGNLGSIPGLGITADHCDTQGPLRKRVASSGSVDSLLVNVVTASSNSLVEG